MHHIFFLKKPSKLEIRNQAKELHLKKQFFKVSHKGSNKNLINHAEYMF